MAAFKNRYTVKNVPWYWYLPMELYGWTLALGVYLYTGLVCLTSRVSYGGQALAPGGEYHVVGETVSDQKDGTLGPALWGLHEALFGSRGRAAAQTASAPPAECPDTTTRSRSSGCDSASTRR